MLSWEIKERDADEMAKMYTAAEKWLLFRKKEHVYNPLDILCLCNVNATKAELRDYVLIYLLCILTTGALAQKICFSIPWVQLFKPIIIFVARKQTCGQTIPPSGITTKLSLLPE